MIFNQYLTEDIIYWELNKSTSSDTIDPDAVTDNYHVPRLIKCYWQEALKEIVVDNGLRCQSTGMIWTLIDITPGSYVHRSSILANVEDRPRIDSGARRIMAFEKTSLPCSTWTERLGYLE